MKIKTFFNSTLILIIVISCSSKEKETAEIISFPSFGAEIEVTINGLSFDAMEPFISSDGNFLFFNSLNNNINTKLYYATKVNDSTFNFVGELAGTNQTIEPHLDAVADMDANNNFYWTSTRNYPAELQGYKGISIWILQGGS